MSESKRNPMAADRDSKNCPVCGKRSYSREGIHPQCAALRADAPRRLLLAAEKKAKAAERQRTREESEASS